MAAGRDGKAYSRDVAVDVMNYSQVSNVKLIVCLLNDYEIRSIGCNVKQYEQACANHDIELFKYPIIEMAPPEDIEKFHCEVIVKVLETMKKGHNVLTHCRGGIGRAGLLACCISAIVLNDTFTSAKDVIAYVRSKRDRRCVESRK